MERKISENPALLSTIFDTSLAAIIFVNPDGEIIFANYAAEKILGLTASKMQGRRYDSPEWKITDFKGRVLPDEKYPFRIVMNKRAPAYNIQHAIEWRNGDRKFLSINGSPILDKKGRIEFCVFSVIDITQSISLEEEMQMLLDTVPAMVFYKDDKNNIIHANRLAADAIGSTPEEMANTPTSRWYPSEAEEYFHDDLEVIKSGKPRLGIIEQITIGKDQKKWVRTDKFPYRDRAGRIKGVVVYAIDITNEKQAQEDFFFSESLYRMIFERAATGMVMVDTKGNFQQVNSAFCAFLGYPREDLLGLNVLDVTAPQDLKLTRQVLKKNSTKEVGITDFEKRYKRKDGQIVWGRVTSNWVLNNEGVPMYAIAQIIDITQQKAAEEKVLHSQKELEKNVKLRTKQLRKEVEEKNKIAHSLKKKEKQLVRQTAALEQKNTALNELLGQIEVEKKQIQENILSNIQELLMPSLEKLKRKGTKLDRKNIQLLENNLTQITSSFGQKMSVLHLKLSPKEMEVCNMVKNGLLTKEMSTLLNLSSRTIENHRNHIRQKLGLSGKNINLTTYLKSL